MGPIPEAFLQTPNRKTSRFNKFARISTTNKLMLKPRAFKIPKCNLEGQKRMKILREKYLLSPLMFLEKEYNEFSKSMEDLCNRQFKSASAATVTERIPPSDNSPSCSYAGTFRRLSDSECDYFPLVHQEDNCNCRDCKQGAPLWSDDSDDEEDNSSKDNDKKKNSGSHKQELQNREEADSGVDTNADEVSFDLNASEMEMEIPSYEFDLESFGEENSQSVGTRNPLWAPNNPASEFNVDALVEYCNAELENSDLSLDVENIQNQVQNLHLGANQPQRVVVNINDPIDELIIDLFPHETIESLFPNEFPDVNYYNFSP